MVVQLERRLKQREELLTAIGAAEARQSLTIDYRIVEQAVMARVDQWRTFLTTEPNAAGTRQFMRELLKGPLTFTALTEQKACRFEGEASRE